MPDILSQLQNIFREVLDQPDLVLKPEDSAATISDWDSLTHIILTMAIEKHFHIKFALGELEELKNVGEMISLIEQKLARA